MFFSAFQVQACSSDEANISLVIDVLQELQNIIVAVCIPGFVSPRVMLPNFAYSRL